MSGTVEKTKDYDTCTHEEIVEHMARAFFACAWSDYAHEYTDMSLSGCEILDVMPCDIDPSAMEAACKLAREIEERHGRPLAEVYQSSVTIAGSDGDRDKTPEMFGHYVAMGAMGHGVGLWDAFGYDADEFVGRYYFDDYSCFDLDPDQYPIDPESECVGG